MKEHFIRFMSSDNIELCGILYTPNGESKKTVIHVHGLAGNFYENRFVSYLAKLYTEKGYNFLTFNNRGSSYFCDLLKQENEVSFINGGGAYEHFEDSIFDIDGIIKYLEGIGNEEIILQGHSYGCNKIIHYYHQNKRNDIKKIILLAPCDIVEEIKVFMADKYNYCVVQAKQFINENKNNQLIDSPLFPLTFSANTFLNDWVPDSVSDIFRYRLDNYIHKELKDIDIPILIEIGEKDECVLVVNKEKIENYFENNLNTAYQINYVSNSPHNYLNQETCLVDDIKKWL